MIYGTHNDQVLEDWGLEYISPVPTSKLDKLYTQFHRSVNISPGTVAYDYDRHFNWDCIPTYWTWPRILYMLVYFQIILPN